MDPLAPTVLSEAVLPASSASDGQSANGRTLSELMLAANFAALRTAVPHRRRGLMTTVLVTPGALSDRGAPCGCSFSGGCC